MIYRVAVGLCTENAPTAIESAILIGGLGGNRLYASAFTLGPVTLEGGAWQRHAAGRIGQ